MRRSIREVNMNMIDAAALEMVGKVKGIARALLCLGAGAIFSLVRSTRLRGHLPSIFAFFSEIFKISCGGA